MTTHGWNRWRALGGLAAGSALLLGLASVSVQSYAASAEQADAGGAGDLVIEAQPHPTEFFDMSPGESRYWSIEASLLGTDRGSLALRVFGEGALIEHPQHPLTIAVEACEGMLVGDDPREHPACEGGAYSPVIAEQPLAAISSDPEHDQADHVWTLPDIVRDQDQSFVVTLALPEGAADDKTLMGLRGDIGVGLFAAGEDPDPDPVPDPEAPREDPDAGPIAGADPTEPGDLATTGGMLPIALLLIGAGTIGLGLVLRRVHTARQELRGQS